MTFWSVPCARHGLAQGVTSIFRGFVSIDPDRRALHRAAWQRRNDAPFGERRDRACEISSAPSATRSSGAGDLPQSVHDLGGPLSEAARPGRDTALTWHLQTWARLPRGQRESEIRSAPAAHERSAMLDDSAAMLWEGFGTHSAEDARSEENSVRRSQQKSATSTSKNLRQLPAGGLFDRRQTIGIRSCAVRGAAG